MGTNDWTCPPREHDYTELMVRGSLNGEQWEPARIFCRRCGWVRQVPTTSVDTGDGVPRPVD